MTELETLLLRQFKQQQVESEKLLSELFLQLNQLQKALSDQQQEAAELGRELERSDQKTMALFEEMKKHVDQLTQLLSVLVT